MRSVFTMWRNTRMIILAAVCAAIYGAALVAFKTAIPLIPGITEVRVANIFPMAFGLLFGPAGAWGTAIGNLMGDLFGGTLGPGSVGGFLGNFFLGYLPFAMWTTWKPFAETSREWKPGSTRSWVSYILISFVSSAACAVVVSACVDALGIVPYSALVKIITLNNTLASWIGIALLLSVFSVTKQQLGLHWVDVMDEEDIGHPVAGMTGAWLVAAAATFGCVGGVATSLSAAAVGWICTVAILIGCFLL